MIPKKLHLCWLSGDKFPEKIDYCVSTWKKKLPDYEIVLWDLNKVDLNKLPWVKAAYEHKKYSYACDYIRAYALYTEGGIYMDSDVEVIKRFDDLLDLPYFIGREKSGMIEPAIMGSEPGMQYMKDIVDHYDSKPFVMPDGSLDLRTLPDIATDVANSEYTMIEVSSPAQISANSDELCILPADYFSPKRNDNFKVEQTSNTYTIHHFTATWFPPKAKFFRFVSKYLGFRFAVAMSNLFKR